MRWWVTIAGVLLGPLLMHAAVIEVREKATVAEGALVRLKDIARITDADPIKAAALGEITLAPAPAAGRSQRVSFDELRNRLQAHGINLAEIEFRGQSTVTVTTPGAAAVRPVSRPEPVVRPTPAPLPPTRLQQQQAEQLLQRAFERAFQVTSTEKLPLRVECACEPVDVPLILSTAVDRIRFVEPNLQVGAPQAITAHWSGDAGQLESVVVRVSVSVVPRRLAVRHPVPAGYPLQPDDLEWVAGEADPQAVTALADAVGKETKKTLRARQLLTIDALTTTPLVKQNDIVTVQVRRPGVVVRRMFKAQSTGALHDTVTLVAVDDPRLRVQGIVTGFHEATIVEQTSPTMSGRTSP